MFRSTYTNVAGKNYRVGIRVGPHEIGEFGVQVAQDVDFHGRRFEAFRRTLTSARRHNADQLGRYIPHTDYLMHTIDVPDDGIESLARKALVTGWNAVPHTAVSQAIGDEWLQSGRGLALRVPGVHSQSDANILLNPEHPDVQRMRVLARTRYQFDRRLF